MTNAITLFPLTRRLDLIADIAGEMARRSPAAADRYFLGRVEILWDEYEATGVDCVVLEAEFLKFVEAVRSELWRTINSGRAS